MAQTKALVSLLNTKLNLVTSQWDELHGTLGSYVNKMATTARATLEAETQDLYKIKEANSMLEKGLEYLVQLSVQVEEDTKGFPLSNSASTPVLAVSPLIPSELPSEVSQKGLSKIDDTPGSQPDDLDHNPLSSLSQLELPTAMLQRSPSSTDTAEITKLHQRLQVLELALSACCSEISQTAAQQNAAANEMEARCESLEAKLGIYSTKTTNFEKRFENIHASSVKQGQKLQNLHDKLTETEERNSELLKQQGSKLEAVESLLQQIDKQFSARMDDKDSRQMAKTEERLKEMEKKLNDSEKLNNTRMTKTEEQLKQTGMKHAETVKQSNGRLGDMEKRVKKLETTGRLDATCLDGLVKDIETMKNQYSKRHQSSKLHILEESVESLTSQCCSLQEQVQDISYLKQTTKELTSRMDEYADRSDLIDVMKTSKSLKNSLEDLSLRVDAVEMSVKSAASNREKEENKRMELEDRVCVVEINRTKDLEQFTAKLDEVESLFKQVCHLIDIKVEPLRRLQRILNDYHKRVEKREELSQRMDEITKQVTDISAELQKLGNNGRKQQQPRVGFTAYYPDVRRVPSEKTIITDFSDILCNEGNYYDPVTGVFTAPRDGLFLTTVTLRQPSEGKADVQVMHDSITHGQRIAAKAATCKDKTSCCGIGIVSMKIGDTLSVKVINVTGVTVLSNYSSFSCFAIS